MSFGRYAVLFAPVEFLLQFLPFGLSLYRLIRPPFDSQFREIEQGSEAVLEFFDLFGRQPGAEHFFTEVAKQKILAHLIDFHFGIFQGLACCIDKNQGRVALAVGFDVLPGFGQVFFFQSGFFGDLGFGLTGKGEP